jgi:Mce-associated membrane protein
VETLEHEPAEAGREGAASEASRSEDGALQAMQSRGADGRSRKAGRGIRRFFGEARVAWAVAILALVAAVLAGLQWQSLRSAAATRDQVNESAQEIAKQVTTFEGATIDQWVEETAAMSTGDYAEQVKRLFDQQFKTALRENEVTSEGTIVNTFTQNIDGNEAKAFVLARQTSRNAQRSQPVEDELRMEITMQREEGEWLASQVAVLGPSTTSLPGGQQQGQAGAGQQGSAGQGGSAQQGGGQQGGVGQGGGQQSG